MASLATLNRKTHYVGVNPPTGDYNDMVNKPAIDGVELTSSTTKADLGLDTVYNYKGQVATYDDLPSSGNHVGDVWNVVDTGENYAWNEDDEWDCLTGAEAVYFRNGKLESTGVAISIDADKNSISNIETEDLKSGVLQTTVRAIASASDTALASEKAIRTELNTKQDTIDENNKLPAQYIDDNESSKKLVSLTPNIYAPENYGYYDWNDEEQSFTVTSYNDELIRATYYADRLEGNYVLDFNTYELYTADGDERKAILVAIKTVYSEEDFIRAYIENDKLCLIVKDDSGDWSEPVISDNTFTQGEKYHIHMEWSEDTPIVSVTMTNRNDNTDVITVESDTQFYYGEYGSYIVFSDKISETEETDEWTYVHTEIILKDAKLSGFEGDRERILWEGMSAFGTGESLSRGLDNFNELGQAKWDSKQDAIDDLDDIRSGASAGATALQSGDLKTINGESVVGSGDIVITTNYSFDNSWTTNTTMSAFLNDVYTDAKAIPGMTYIGELTCSDLPTGLNNAEAVVEVMPSATAATKALHVVITSGNLDPYRWELTYWVIGNTPHNSGWIAFQPKLTQGTGITISNNTISANTMVGSNGTTAGSAGIVPAPAKTDNTKFLKGDGTWATVDALPSQSGQSGKFLTTDGSVASWATLDTALNGTTAPTNATVGSLGQIYVDTVANEGYVCTNINSNVYTWKRITYTPSSTTVTLASANWNTTTKEYTLPVVGLTATTIVWLAPSVSADNSNEEAYATYGVRVKAQANGSITLGCTTVPPSNIDVELIM